MEEKIKAFIDSMKDSEFVTEFEVDEFQLGDFWKFGFHIQGRLEGKLFKISISKQKDRPQKVDIKETTECEDAIYELLKEFEICE